MKAPDFLGVYQGQALGVAFDGAGVRVIAIHLCMQRLLQARCRVLLHQPDGIERRRFGALDGCRGKSGLCDQPREQVNRRLACLAVTQCAQG